MNFQQQALNYKRYKQAGTTTIWQIKGSAASSPFFYQAGLIVDFDGAPDAYAPPVWRPDLGHWTQVKGRDIIWNAVPVMDKNGQSPWLAAHHKLTDRPTNPHWIPTFSSTVRDKTGASVIQSTGPTAGYYISESSLKDARHHHSGSVQTDVAYQTDADTYPYVVLPQALLQDSGITVGDYALAIHGRTGRYSFAAYGDAKNKHVMGESSSALAKALGVGSSRKGGIGRGIIYIVFPGSGSGFQRRCDLAALPANGLQVLKLFNQRMKLVSQVKSCFTPEFPGVASAFGRMGL